ncbi:MAG: 6,7-dimethyl-8-ribityllumazine synthase, partial [Actinomycetota bacterium]|nr:6,7-dimethyl-8-ribityllumazine synthase [Actinomycetota bacterium]
MNTIDAPLDGTGLRVGLVAGRFNDFVSNNLVDGARTRLVAMGVADDDIDLAWVAGAFEVPLAARAMAESGRYDAVVCLGAVIRGETPHF